MVEEDFMLSSCFYPHEVKGCFGVTQLTTGVQVEVPKTPLMKLELVSRLGTSPAGSLLFIAGVYLT